MRARGAGLTLLSLAIAAVPVAPCASVFAAAPADGAAAAGSTYPPGMALVRCTCVVDLSREGRMEVRLLDPGCDYVAHRAGADLPGWPATPPEA